MSDTQRRALLADDFTGALDTGVQFLKEGRRPILFIPDEVSGSPGRDTRDSATFVSSPAAGEEVLLMVDTETRFLDSATAAQTVSAATGALLKAGYEPFFKKIDSTLRGNVGAELEGMIDILEVPALVAPAVPANGRTLVEGVVYVNGLPLTKSESGKDPFTPNRTSKAAEILASQTTRRIKEVPLKLVRRGGEEIARLLEAETAEGREIILFDGSSEAHLRSIAEGVRLFGRPLLLAGASGLAAALATVEADGPGGTAEGRLVGEEILSPGRALIVAGSLMGTTVEQAQRLSREAATVSTLFVDAAGALSAPSEERARLLNSAGAAISEGRHLLLRTTAAPGAATVPKGSGLELAQFVGELSREILESSPLESLILTGGSTALAVVRALGIDRMRIIGEVQTGVPLSKGGSHLLGREYRIVTKAGGFGDSGALLRMVAALDGELPRGT